MRSAAVRSGSTASMGRTWRIISLCGVGNRRTAMSESRNCEWLGIDMGRLAAEQFRDELACRRGHREAEHVVARGDPDIVHCRTPVDDRQTVIGHRPPAKPLFFHRITIRFAKIVAR